MFLVLFVLDNFDFIEDLLIAWEAEGVQGATMLHSSGLGRVRQGGGLRDDLPLIPSLEALYQHEEYFSRTIFTILDTQDMVDHVVEATQRVVGDLNKPNTGILVVVPVLKVYGLEKNQSDRSSK